MNWTIEYLEDVDYVRVETRGYFTEQDNQALLTDLVYQSYWKPGINILFDNRKRNYHENGLEHMRQISRQFFENDAFIGCGRIALLMKSVADFNLGREFEMLTDEEICADVRIFLNEILAVSWIRGTIGGCSV